MDKLTRVRKRRGGGRQPLFPTPCGFMRLSCIIHQQIAERLFLAIIEGEEPWLPILR